MNHYAVHRDNYFLFFCIAGAIVLMYFIARPFLAPLVLAAMAAFLFQSPYQALLAWTKNKTSLSAFLTTILAVILIIIPISLLGTFILKESTDLYHSLATEQGSSLAGFAETLVERVRSVVPLPDSLVLNVDQYVRQGLEALVANLGAIFSSVAKQFLNIFVFLVAFYFFLKDGRALRGYFIALSPLVDSNDEMILSRLERAVVATVKGNLMIGLIQGALTGIGFFIFGVPNPVLWGSLAAVTALIPGIGTALVTGPAIAFLLLTNETTSAVGLLVWGAGAVGIVDNLLGPRLVGQGMRLHPLVVFIAVLGGLAFFGPIGFLLGPLAVSLCIALIDIYFSLKSSHSETV